MQLSSIKSNSSKKWHASRIKQRKSIELTYRSNSDSDYTEKIQELDRNFDYDDNLNYYWTDPEQSLLYGTPLYEVASSTQKKALNHLYWVIQNNNTAASEVNTIIYNQVTAGVFQALGGYEKLCRELELETSQEYHHIHAFQKIGYKTKVALLGKQWFRKLRDDKSTQANQEKLRLLPDLNFALRFVAKTMLKKQEYCSSEYLKELEKKGEFFPTPTQGSGGRFASPALLKFFTLNWGSSPFLACHYYTLRYVSNALLKNQEHPRSRYFTKLKKKGEFIPAPTAVSHYHFLDESFHTTISQIIGRELYRDFPQPTGYEKFVANVAVFLAQRNVIDYHGGLCFGLPARCFRDDSYFMNFIYKLLQSPLFDLSSEEALYWMEKCFCHEHQGFHVAQKYHRGFVSDFRRFFGGIDYLWSFNREMRLIDSGISVAGSLQKSTKIFQQFRHTLGKK
ncbi:hypothetical protein [Myxosarcina sp. GI1(2024)]